MVSAIDSSVYANNYYYATGNTATSYDNYLSAMAQADTFNSLLNVTDTSSSTGSSTSSLADTSLIDTVSLSPAALNLLTFLQNNNIASISNDNNLFFQNGTLTSAQQAELTSLLQQIGLSGNQVTQVIAVFNQFTGTPVTQNATALSQAENQNIQQTAANSTVPATATPTTSTIPNQTTPPDQNPQNGPVAESSPTSREAMQQSFVSGYVQQPLPPAREKKDYSDS